MKLHKKGSETIAYTTITPLHATKQKSVAKSVNDILDYGKNPDKTQDGKLVSCYECDPTYSADQFLMKKQVYEQITQRRESNNERNVLAYHLIQSFSPEDKLTPEQANGVGMELARKFAGDDFQIVVCTHTDTLEKDGVLHNHIYINSTSLDCTRKFDNVKDSALRLQEVSDSICRSHGLSVIEDKGDKGIPYSDWLDKKEGLDWKEVYKADIDRVLADSSSMDEFKENMKALGYSLRGKKTLSMKHLDRTRGMRTERISDKYDYSLKGIEYALKHNGRMLPKTKKINLEADTKVNTLHSLEGKTGGLKLWAEKQNLKELAKANNYLKQNGYKSYEEFTEKYDSFTSGFEFTTEKIKQLDTALKDGKALQVHITNYARTVNTFKEYRKSRHKAEFYEDNKGNMLLYEASVQAFKNLGLKSVPKMVELKANLSTLQMEKDAEYKAYKKLRTELNELRPVKQNLDSFLADDQKKIEQDRQREEINPTL